MPQIRLNKTPELEQVLSFLQRKYRLLSEAEIIKVAISEKYQKEVKENMPKVEKSDDAYSHLVAEGKKIGDKLLAKKDLKRENVSEQEFYDLFLNHHKDNA